MKISDLVANKIRYFRKGYVFTYKRFKLSVKNISALRMALDRLVDSGKIIRLSKGQFFKPEIDESGAIQPPVSEIIKDLFRKGKKNIGYQTGIIVFNKLGLTTQISDIIEIGTNRSRKPLRRGELSIRFISQKNTIYKKNIHLLQILDSIRLIKSIPGSELTESCVLIMDLMKELPEADLVSIAKLALKYNPGTRALTGAMLDHVTDAGISRQLLDSLNPVSVFRFDISDDILTNKLKWRIT